MKSKNAFRLAIFVALVEFAVTAMWLYLFYAVKLIRGFDSVADTARFDSERAQCDAAFATPCKAFGPGVTVEHLDEGTPQLMLTGPLFYLMMMKMIFSFIATLCLVGGTVCRATQDSVARGRTAFILSVIAAAISNTFYFHKVMANKLYFGFAKCLGAAEVISSHNVTSPGGFFWPWHNVIGSRLDEVNFSAIRANMEVGLLGKVASFLAELPAAFWGVTALVLLLVCFAHCTQVVAEKKRCEELDSPSADDASYAALVDSSDLGSYSGAVAGSSGGGRLAMGAANA